MVEAREEDHSIPAGRLLSGAFPHVGSNGNQGVSELRELLAAVEAYRADVVVAIRAAREVLAAGELRDAAADRRDEEARTREHGRDLAALLDIDAEYGADLPERRASALDRERAKQDRIAARLDRWMLVDQIRNLIQAGGRGVRQDALPALPRTLNRTPSPRKATSGPRRRAQSGVRQQPDARTAERMHLAGTVWAGGVEQPINLDVASWEEAVARLNQRYGPDAEYALRTDVAVTRRRSS